MDINALKQRMQQLNNRGGNKPKDIWKPKDEHEIRCLPYPYADDPFVVIHFHYDLGDQSIICPKETYGDECAVCEFAETLKAWKDADGNDKRESVRKEDWELFKKIQSKARVLVPMVERGKEAEGAKWWSISPNQVNSLLEVCADGDCLEAVGVDKDDTKNAIRVLIGTEKGFDLKVSFKKPGEKGNAKTFPVTDVKSKIKATPLLSDKAAMKKLLESVKRVDEVYPKTSATDAESALNKFLGKGRAEASSKPEDSEEKYPRTTNSGESAKRVGRSIDEALDDLVREDD